MTKKFQWEVSQIAEKKFQCVMLLGGLSVNLNHLKTWNVDDIISTFEVNDLEFLSPILWIMNQPQEIMTWDKKSGETSHSGK